MIENNQSPQKHSQGIVKPGGKGDNAEKNNLSNQKKKTMKKDEESLLRMNFLYQAAQMYKHSKQLSSYFLKELIQVSQKKMVRIGKPIKKKFCKKCSQFFTTQQILKKESRKLKKLRVNQNKNTVKQVIIVENRMDIENDKK